VGDQLFNVDRDRRTEKRMEGQTDMTNPTAAFRNFAKKKHKILYRVFFRKGTLERPERRWVNIIIADVKETGLESTDRIILDQNKNEMWTVVLSIKIRRVSVKRSVFIKNSKPYPLSKEDSAPHT
jgi:hypothetical protein